MTSLPTYTCSVCDAKVTVDPYARGFPPDAAKRKLIKQCKANGHTADPRYLAGGAAELIAYVQTLSADKN